VELRDLSDNLEQLEASLSTGAIDSELLEDTLILLEAREGPALGPMRGARFADQGWLSQPPETKDARPEIEALYNKLTELRLPHADPNSKSLPDHRARC
jgi:hypothetical protein